MKEHNSSDAFEAETIPEEVPFSPTYEVQTFTICDGWVNTWAVLTGYDTSTPETFRTENEAQAAIDDFIAEIDDEIAAGERELEDRYIREDFRIVRTDAVFARH